MIKPVRKVKIIVPKDSRDELLITLQKEEIVMIAKHDANTFINNISATGGSVKLLDSSGAQQSGNVGTGSRVAVYDASNNLKATYDIVVYGDTSGDGVISVKDLIMINRQILNLSNLSGASLTAADVSRDGNVSVKDLIMVNNSILGKSTISQ